MVNCPSCNFKIESDFGLVTCDSCMAQIFIGFDGDVAIQDESDAQDKDTQDNLSDLASLGAIEPTEKPTEESVEDDGLDFLDTTNVASIELPDELPSELLSALPDESAVDLNVDVVDDLDSFFSENNLNTEPTASSDISSAIDSDVGDDSEEGAVFGDAYESFDAPDVANLSLEPNDETHIEASGHNEINSDSLIDITNNDPTEGVIGDAVEDTIEDPIVDGSNDSDDLDDNNFEDLAYPGDSTGDDLGDDPDKKLDVNAPLDAEDPFGVTEYAGSERSAASQGPIIYNIDIIEVTSERLRRLILKVISHSKLKLESYVEDLAQAELPHSLKLKNIGPVKASYVISNLQVLGVGAKWKQISVEDSADNSIDTNI